MIIFIISSYLLIFFLFYYYYHFLTEGGKILNLHFHYEGSKPVTSFPHLSHKNNNFQFNILNSRHGKYITLGNVFDNK